MDGFLPLNRTFWIASEQSASLGFRNQSLRSSSWSFWCNICLWYWILSPWLKAGKDSLTKKMHRFKKQNCLAQAGANSISLICSCFSLKMTLGISSTREDRCRAGSCPKEEKYVQDGTIVVASAWTEERAFPVLMGCNYVYWWDSPCVKYWS